MSTCRTCQFPEGDPRDLATFRLCGAPVTQPGSYCDACRAKAYQSSGAKRPVSLRKSAPRRSRAEADHSHLGRWGSAHGSRVTGPRAGRVIGTGGGCDGPGPIVGADRYGPPK
jgi:hypothetical protein